MPGTSSSSVRVFSPRWTKEGVIAALRERLPALTDRLPLVRVVLFGSYASGRFTPASDVDLLVVYRGAPRPDAYALVRKTLAVAGLEAHVYAEDEARALAPTLERMTRGGIVLLDRPAEGRADL